MSEKPSSSKSKTKFAFFPWDWDKPAKSPKPEPGKVKSKSPKPPKSIPEKRPSSKEKVPIDNKKAPHPQPAPRTKSRSSASLPPIEKAKRIPSPKRDLPVVVAPPSPKTPTVTHLEESVIRTSNYSSSRSPSLQRSVPLYPIKSRVRGLPNQENSPKPKAPENRSDYQHLQPHSRSQTDRFGDGQSSSRSPVESASRSRGAGRGREVVVRPPQPPADYFRTDRAPPTENEEDLRRTPGFSMRDRDSLTFESAVLALIRLRRLQSQLYQKRERNVRELELFRGWNDERYVYVLDQIAKSNLQMDELDPLIASLEAFVHEQQSPAYIPEDHVIRYPASSFAQRHRFPPIMTTGTVREVGVTQNNNAKINGYGSKTVSRGGGAERLQTAPSAAGELERELDTLKDQVRQLQLEKDHLQRSMESFGVSDGQPVAGREILRSDREYQRERQSMYSDANMTQGRRRGPFEEPNKFQMTRSTSETRHQLSGNSNKQRPTNSRSPMQPDEHPYHQPLNGPRRRSETNSHTSRSVTTNSSGSSDEVSVDEPCHFEDFNGFLSNDLDDSLTKMQDIVRELEAPKKSVSNTTPEPYSTGYYRGNTPRNGYESSENGYPPLPSKSVKRNAGKGRRHNTVSSANPSAILAAAALLADNSKVYAHDDMPDVVSNGYARNHEKEEVSYDFQMRLDSPDKILIPERYLDVEQEQDDDVQRNRRLIKAENIRRMLAIPEPGTTDTEQRAREKVLLMTPILAREVKERSRKVALQAKKRVAAV